MTILEMSRRDSGTESNRVSRTRGQTPRADGGPRDSPKSLRRGDKRTKFVTTRRSPLLPTPSTPPRADVVLRQTNPAGHKRRGTSSDVKTDSSVLVGPDPRTNQRPAFRQKPVVQSEGNSATPKRPDGGLCSFKS